ncbi:GNAT family N-acetyltransferase [Listeria valentina]|uniref:GNAT family N-acetyltransferase n=1 Tax=Listeria valentina TaxID=2705293 RepID=UPI00142FEA45|nr:GNAT family N-acetyltransferase [Listeria valentina]
MIRRIEKQDLEQAEKLLLEVKEGLNAHQWNQDYPSKMVLQSDLKARSLFGWFEAERLFAMVTLTEQLTGTVKHFNWQEAKSPVFIKRVMTSPLKRGQGLALELLQFAEGEARKAQHDTLCSVTSVNNRAMLHLFDKEGFKKVAEGSIRERYPYHEFFAFQKEIGRHK